MRRLIAIIVSSLFAISAFAQEDAFCTWTNVSFDKSIGKWSVGLMTEYRHKIHEGVSKTDQYFARPRVTYSALKWLKLGYQMDLAATSSGFNVRFLPEITFSKKVGDFSFAFRQRVQTTWKVEQGSNSTVLRSRGKVDSAFPRLLFQYILQSNLIGPISSRTALRGFRKSVGMQALTSR